jgi:dCTP deaminase
MSFWSGEKIAANPFVVTEFSLDQVDANAYNLRMGNCYFRTADDSGGTD